MTDEAQTYNGWSNYPTWAVALWINNDQGWQESVREQLRDLDVAQPGGPTDPADIQRHLAYEAGKVIRESVDSDVSFSFGTHDSPPASLAADLIGWALDSADWTEIGASFLTDLDEQ